MVQPGIPFGIPWLPSVLGGPPAFRRGGLPGELRGPGVLGAGGAGRRARGAAGGLRAAGGSTGAGEGRGGEGVGRMR